MPRPQHKGALSILPLGRSVNVDNRSAILLETNGLVPNALPAGTMAASVRNLATLTTILKLTR